MSIRNKGNEVFRDYSEANNPASGIHDPVKPEIRDLFRLVESEIQTSREIKEVGVLGANTLDQLRENNPEVGTVGVVFDDPANNGYYLFGAAGWVFTRPLKDTVALVTPDGGTGDEIEAYVEAGFRPDTVRLFVMAPALVNTGPVHLTIDGAPRMPLKNPDGTALAAGYLQPDAYILFTATETEYRILVDQRFQFLTDQASAAAEDAEAARQQAQSILDSFEDLILPSFSIGTVETVEAGEPASASISGEAPNYILNLEIPEGEKGDPIDLSIGTVTTVGPNDPADAQLVAGEPGEYTLNLSIPQGQPADDPEPPAAVDVPFDNTSNGFTADNVQTAIEEAAQMSGATGTVIWSVVDPGDAYLPCDGLIYLLSAYPDLASEIGQIDAYSIGVQRTAAGSYSGTFNDVINAGGTLVACGASGGLQTSPDGDSWTQRAAGSSYTGTFNKLLWTGTSIIVVGNGSNGVQTSPAGATWTARSAGTANRAGIATDGTNIVIVGSGGDIRHSTNDGATWTQRTPGGSYSGNFTGVIYVPFLSLFVAFGSGGSIQTSPTGVTWTQQTADASYSGSLLAGAVFDGFIVLFGQSGEIQTSADGSTWTRRATGGQSWNAARSINGTLFAVGSLGKVGISKDATAWRIAEGEAGKPNLQAVIQAGDGVFAVGNDGAAQIGYSPFAVWNEVAVGGGYTGFFSAAAAIEHRIVAVGSAGGIQTFDPDYDLDTEFAVPTLGTIGNIVVPYIRT